MIINTPISLGELMDKISILTIKQKNILDEGKLIYINDELSQLKETLNNSVNDKKIKDYLEKLININSILWKIEDDIRDCERNKNFDQIFIDLARFN